MADRRLRSRWPIVAIVVSLVLTGACGILDEGDPEEARVEVTSSAAGTVVLLTSSNFTVTPGGAGETVVTLNASDTSEVTLPFERRYDLGPLQRFYVRATSADSVGGQNVSMKVFIDGDERFRQTRTLTQDFMEFIYVFR